MWVTFEPQENKIGLNKWGIWFNQVKLGLNPGPGKLDFVWQVNGKSKLTEFDLAGFYFREFPSQPHPKVYQI